MILYLERNNNNNKTFPFCSILKLQKVYTKKGDFLILRDFDLNFYLSFTLYSLKLFTHVKSWCKLLFYLFINM